MHIIHKVVYIFILEAQQKYRIELTERTDEAVLVSQFCRGDKLASIIQTAGRRSPPLIYMWAKQMNSVFKAHNAADTFGAFFSFYIHTTHALSPKVEKTSQIFPRHTYILLKLLGIRSRHGDTHGTAGSQVQGRSASYGKSYARGFSAGLNPKPGDPAEN
jgi:hypothetical protein